MVAVCAGSAWGGAGGAGAVSFRREARVPKGGPDGGDGGDGGDVWLMADHNVASLLAFRDHPHRRATNGKHGSGGKRHGRSAKDLVISLPEGTTVRDLHGGPVLADLLNHGDRWLAAEAGRGGRGNARFLSNRRRVPNFAEQGEEGEERWLRLEVRLMADVALVGFPNSGKSTLISRISAAKPKIADYPFTTLEPNLGVVQPATGSEFVVADIPGLIAGASTGRGLGHRFLKHVERSRVLLLLLDLAATAEYSPIEQQTILESELGAYQPELLKRRRLVVGSRCDMDSGQTVFSGERISGVTGEGLKQLIYRMSDLVVKARTENVLKPAVVVHRPAPVDIAVVRIEDGVWEIADRRVARVANLDDMTNPDALSYLREQFRKMGVDRSLRKAGVRSGDSVRIGRIEFDYEEEDSL